MVGAPTYLEIREALRRRIVSRAYQPGEKLPNELELARQFRVSRMTLRRALNDLVNEGLLRRVPGVGTFATQRHLRSDHTRLRSFWETTVSLGLTPSSRVVEAAQVDPDDVVRGSLELDRNAQVYRICRVRLADGEPLAFHEAYIPCDLMPGLLERDLAGSLYGYYREFGFVIASGEQLIQACAADARLAELLEVPPGTPLLYIERVTRTSSGSPIEFLRGYLRSDRYPVYMTLRV